MREYLLVVRPRGQLGPGLCAKIGSKTRALGSSGPDKLPSGRELFISQYLPSDEERVRLSLIRLLQKCLLFSRTFQFDSKYSISFFRVFNAKEYPCPHNGLKLMTGWQQSRREGQYSILYSRYLRGRGAGSDWSLTTVIPFIPCAESTMRSFVRLRISGPCWSYLRSCTCCIWWSSR